MSEKVTISKDEWEAFLRDSEELIAKYDALLRKVNELEESKKDLEQRLQLAKEQLRRVEEMERTREIKAEKHIINDTEKIRNLHSKVNRLLQTELPEPSTTRPKEGVEVKEEVEVGVVEITPKAEPAISKESKTVEKILRERREAAMKLLKEDEET